MKLAGTMGACILAVLLAGCTDFTPTQVVHPNRLSILTIDVAAPRVSAGSVVLAVNVSIDNSDARSGDLDVVAKAFDLGTGLLALTNHSHIGRLARDVTVPVEVRLDLPHADGYRIEVSVAQDGQVALVQEVSASNLANLAVNAHQTGLGIDGVDFRVLDTNAGKVTFRATTYVTNEGRTTSAPLRLQLKAREVSTDLVADEEWVDVPALAVDATQPLPVELTVPQAYNYVVEAILWQGQIVVERGSGHVQLVPTSTIPAGERSVVTHPDVSAFRDPQSDPASGLYGRAGGAAPSTARKAATPGFEFAAGAVALLACLVLVRRRMHP